MKLWGTDLGGQAIRKKRMEQERNFFIFVIFIKKTWSDDKYMKRRIKKREGLASSFYTYYFSPAPTEEWLHKHLSEIAHFPVGFLNFYEHEYLD